MLKLKSNFSAIKYNNISFEYVLILFCNSSTLHTQFITILEAKLACSLHNIVVCCSIKP